MDKRGAQGAQGLRGSGGGFNTGRRLTVLIAAAPARRLGQAGLLPQLVGAVARVLEALLDLDALVRPDDGPEHRRVADGRDKGLVAAAVAVVDVLADHVPLFDVEDLLAQDGVGVRQAVEVESGPGGALESRGRERERGKRGGGYLLPMGETLAVCCRSASAVSPRRRGRGVGAAREGGRGVRGGEIVGVLEAKTNHCMRGCGASLVSRDALASRHRESISDTPTGAPES